MKYNFDEPYNSTVSITENGNNVIITDNTDITARELCGYCLLGMLPGQLPTIVVPTKTNERNEKNINTSIETENDERDPITITTPAHWTKRAGSLLFRSGRARASSSIGVSIAGTGVFKVSSQNVFIKDVIDAPVKKRLYK